VKISKRLVAGVIVMGLFFLTSCKKQDIQKDETAAFLTSLNNTGTELTTTPAFNVLSDFMSKNPPIGFGGKRVIKFNGHEYNLPLKIEAKGVKGGIEDLYGTWEWQDTGWVHVDPNNPQKGILFRWTFYDTTFTAHQAALLIDSIEIYVIGSDTLPQKVHIALYLDNPKIADLSINLQYNTNEQITYLKVVFTVTNEFQIGVEAKNLQYDQNGSLIALQLHLWITDYKNHNFRRDITLTVRSDDSGSIVYTDSDDWKLVMNVSAATQVVENSITYEKRTVTGEITKDGRHAADIRGTIWNPQDENHQTEIYVIFSDGSREPLSNYITIFQSK
jgi:hypothetical protein